MLPWVCLLQVLGPIIKTALELCQMEKLTGREKPTVIT
jgi:hypothetical protein